RLAGSMFWMRTKSTPPKPRPGPRPKRRRLAWLMNMVCAERIALGREGQPLASAATQLALRHNAVITLGREEPDPPPAALVGSPGGEAGSVGSRHAMEASREWSAGKLVPLASLPPRNDLPHRSSRQPLVLRPDRPSRCARQGRRSARLAPAEFALHKKRKFRCFPVDKPHTRNPWLKNLRSLRAISAIAVQYAEKLHVVSAFRVIGVFRGSRNCIGDDLGRHLGLALARRGRVRSAHAWRLARSTARTNSKAPRPGLAAAGCSPARCWLPWAR